MVSPAGGITVMLFISCQLAIFRAENFTLPDGRQIDIPQKYKYHHTDIPGIESEELILRPYILTELKPNTALMCPKGYFISQMSQELFTTSNSSSFTTKKHSSTGAEGEDRESAPCPTIYRCLGMQACLFKFANEFCRRDAAPNLRKLLLVTVSCKKDPAGAFLGSFIKPAFLKRDHVIHLRYHSRLEDPKFQTKRNYQSIKIFEDVLPEGVVFAGNCPPVRYAVSERGYKGECTSSPKSQEDIIEETWTLLGRIKSPICRSEILQVFCAFQYNPQGMCTPPFLLTKEETSEPMFNTHALPDVRERTPLTSSIHTSIHPMSLNPACLGFILLWHKDVISAMELLHSIWRPQHFYVIHLDQRAEGSREVLQQMLAKFPQYENNVILLPESRSFQTAWGSYEIVRAELEAIEELVWRGDWDFVINLSGSDLPLRSVEDLCASLAPYRGFNFLPFVELQNANKSVDELDNLSHKAYYACDGYVYEVTNTAGMPKFSEFQLYNSPQWAVFSREFAEFLVDQKRRSSLINRYQFYLQTHVVPDESYIVSVLMNSPFRSSVKRYAVHTTKEFEANNADNLCRHFTEADFCGQGPSLFEPEDQKDLMSMSHRSFFARKFSGNIGDKTRAFTLGLAKTGYIEFITTFLPRIIVWSLAVEALSYLSSNDDRFLNHELQLEDIKEFRVIPSLVPHRECCRLQCLSRLRKITDHRVWMDITFTDESDSMNLHRARISMVPLINGRFCYKEGDLKMAFLSTWTKKFDTGTEADIPNFGLQETMPLPFGMAGIQRLSVLLVFSRENSTCQGEDADAGETQPMSFSDDFRPLELTLQLFSPLGEATCDQHTTVTFTKGNNTDEDKVLFHIHPIVMDCGSELESGPWTLQITENMKYPAPRIYNLPFYLLDFENDSNIEPLIEEVVHLWKIEETAILPAHDPEENDESPSRSNRKEQHMQMSGIFITLSCYGGVLASTAIGILVHSLLLVKRIHFRLLIRYIFLLSIASVVQGVLLLGYC